MITTLAPPCLLVSPLTVSQCKQSTVVNDRHAVAHTLNFFHVVRRIDHRDPLRLEPLDDTEDRVTRLRINARGRLIHEHHARLVQNRRREVQSSAHPAAEAARSVLPSIGERYNLQRFVHPRGQLCTFEGVHRSKEHQVFLGRQIVVERDRLRCNTDQATHPCVRGITTTLVRFANLHCAAVGLQQARRDRDRGRFPCAVWPEQREALTRFHT